MHSALNKTSRCAHGLCCLAIPSQSHLAFRTIVLPGMPDVTEKYDSTGAAVYSLPTKVQWLRTIASHVGRMHLLLPALQPGASCALQRGGGEGGGEGQGKRRAGKEGGAGGEG